MTSEADMTSAPRFAQQFMTQILALLLGFCRKYPGFTAFLLGALATMGLPPLRLWVLSFLACGALALLIARSTSWRGVAKIGWLFGFGYFIMANSWLAKAFYYQDNLPEWLGWLAPPLSALYLAIYPALAAILARGLWRLINGHNHENRHSENILRADMVFALCFSACWILTEWLRSWMLTGYAWDPLSLTLLGPYERAGLAAALPWTGTYALSGMLVLAASIVAIWIASRRYLPATILAALLITGMLWPAPPAQYSRFHYTLVQPNIQQEDVSDPFAYWRNYQKLAALSVRSQRRAVKQIGLDKSGSLNSDTPDTSNSVKNFASGHTDPSPSPPAPPAAKRVVLWPESGVPDFLESGYPQRFYLHSTAGANPEYARQRLGHLIGEGSLLLAGTVNMEIEQGRAVGLRNAATILSHEGHIIASYDKAHLVPFGEYVPMREVLQPLGLRRFVAGSLEFWPGPGPQTYDLGEWGRVGMMICYEVIFSGQVTDPANRPDYLFNPSNDGWYGRWGPPQHLGQTRLRAIEEGLPILRSTTTGVSAVIDPHGIIRGSIAMNTAGNIHGTVPKAAAPTLFARMGHWLTFAWGLVFLALAVLIPRLLKLSPLARDKRDG